MKGPYKGTCLCASVSFEVDEIQPQMGHCYCTMCRKFHGAAFATYGEALVEHFRWITGENLLKTYLAENGTQRQFCENCGSSLRFIPANDSGEMVEFSIGALDSDIPLKPDAHIFTDYGASWYEITDDLPQYKEHRKS